MWADSEQISSMASVIIGVDLWFQIMNSFWLLIVVIVIGSGRSHSHAEPPA
jgi:hypothetical protein